MIFGEDNTPERSCTLGFPSLTNEISGTHQPVESKFNGIVNSARRESNFDASPSAVLSMVVVGTSHRRHNLM